MAGFAQGISIDATMKDTGFIWAAAMTVSNRVVNGFHPWKSKACCYDMRKLHAQPWWKILTNVRFHVRVHSLSATTQSLKHCWKVISEAWPRVRYPNSSNRADTFL